MNEIWNEISGYVMPIVTMLLTSGLGAALVRALASGWFKKQDLNKMAERFADKLTGSSINVDLTAVAEKQLKRIEERLLSQTAKLQETENTILSVVGDIADCIRSSAKLSEEKKAKLIADLEAVRQSAAPAETRDEIRVELRASGAENGEEPVETHVKAASADASILSFD